jgi:exodeoxyribonuclease V alpha subunit
MDLLTHSPSGPLRPFHTAGVLGLADVHVAGALLGTCGRELALASGQDADVALAGALCVRALRSGSVCIDLAADPQTWLPDEEQVVAEEVPGAPGSAGAAAEPTTVEDLPWPEPGAWRAAVQEHPLVADGPDAPADRPLRIVGSLLYLQRYWLDEQVVRTDLEQRGHARVVDSAVLAAALADLFPGGGADQQRRAAATAALRGATLVAGGPGTGKTTTVARIIALLRRVEGPGLTVALAAPTGKAAARLQEAIAEASATMSAEDRAGMGSPQAATVHRLLGWRPDSRGRFRHDRANPLPHDVVIVDETSMVSLPLMARLLEAVRPDARLVLVGDPDQLASIDAGAVLGDLVEGAAPPSDPATTVAGALDAPDPDSAAAGSGVVVLTHNFRYGGRIGALAGAIRDGDPDRVMEVLRDGGDDVQFLEEDPVGPASPMPAGHRAALVLIRNDVREQTARVGAAAAGGRVRDALAALEGHRVLCAHRQGPWGVGHWSDLIDSWTQDLGGPRTPGDPWYVGRPLLITANDYSLGLHNGDTGVIIAHPDGTARAAFLRGEREVLLPPARLDAVQTLHAMTIHRGQGSQFGAVSVILPPVESRLLTRELLYTAVTRARIRVRVVGTEEAIRAAVDRRVRRASGLRLAP